MFDDLAVVQYLTPTPLCRHFFNTICWQNWQIFDPSPLENANVLNGWSLSCNLCQIGDAFNQDILINNLGSCLCLFSMYSVERFADIHTFVV